jgi:hypothetical protein
MQTQRKCLWKTQRGGRKARAKKGYCGNGENARSEKNYDASSGSAIVLCIERCPSVLKKLLRIFGGFVVAGCLVNGISACTWSVGYFYQVTSLRGTLLGRDRVWILWRNPSPKPNVTMRLYRYRWPLRDRSEMPLVKSLRTNDRGRFDFGDVQQGHYTLIIDWPGEWANWFDVEVTTLPRQTSNIVIDATIASPDCTGGHEFRISSD